MDEIRNRHDISVGKSGGEIPAERLVIGEVAELNPSLKK